MISTAVQSIIEFSKKTDEEVGQLEKNRGREKLSRVQRPGIRRHFRVRQDVETQEVIAAERHVPWIDGSCPQTGGGERERVDETEIAQVQKPLDASQPEAGVSAQM